MQTTPEARPITMSEEFKLRTKATQRRHDIVRRAGWTLDLLCLEWSRRRGSVMGEDDVLQVGPSWVLGLDALEQRRDHTPEPQGDEGARQDDEREFEAERERAAPGRAVMPAHDDAEERAQDQDREQEHGDLPVSSAGIITRDV